MMGGGEHAWVGATDLLDWCRLWALPSLLWDYFSYRADADGKPTDDVTCMQKGSF